MNRTLDVRVDVLRNGAKATELYPVSAPNVQMQSDSEIKMSMTGDFVNNDAVDWLSDELQPIAIINGIEYPFGVFSVATLTTIRSDGSKIINIEAYDRCWKVQAIKTESILHLSAGSNYLTTVESLLLECGISMISKVGTTKTLTYDREDWDIGTDYLTIVNQLLDEINYNPLWFNANGVAILEPDRLLNISQIERVYDYNSVQSMMIDDSSSMMDLFNAPNVFLCVCSNPDGGEPLKAIAENTNFASPLSIPRRRKRIMAMFKLDNIASQEALDEYAQILCTEQMFTGNIINITTAIMPDCGLNDIVALAHPDVDGVCLEYEWSVDLETGGLMQHSLKQQPRASIIPTPVVHTGTIAGIAVAGIDIVGVYS